MALELELEGVLDEERSAIVAAGQADVILGPVPVGFVWRISRAVVSSTSALVPIARLYKDRVNVANLVSGTDAGNFDEAEYPTGLQLQGGQRLIIRFTNATNGAECSASIEG